MGLNEPGIRPKKISEDIRIEDCLQKEEIDKNSIDYSRWKFKAKPHEFLSQKLRQEKMQRNQLRSKSNSVICKCILYF